MGELNNGDEEDITVVIYKTVDDFKGYDIEVENAAAKSDLQTQLTGNEGNILQKRCLNDVTLQHLFLTCVLFHSHVLVLMFVALPSIVLFMVNIFCCSGSYPRFCFCFFCTIFN